MADEKTKQNGGTAVAEAPVKTEKQLMQEMDAALKSGDFKAVAKVANDLAKFQKSKEAAELEAKQKVLADKTLKVKAVIEKALAKMIESGELDQADGIWYTNDFGEKLITCRLMKTAAKTSSGKGGGGGGGKKFAISTSELLEKHGNEEYKDGQTFSAAWEANTDKNWRYAIREALLKKEGTIS